MFNELNTLKLFFEEPNREFNVREVGRILKIAPATASKRLKKLLKYELLKKRKERILDLYKSNLENDMYHDLKIFYNIRKLKESGIIDSLNKFYLKPTIVLFGSGAYGADDETSDFDIVVISERTSKFSDFKNFEKKINRKIQLFNVRNVNELKNEHLINNVLNGIVIQGEIKWI